MTESEFNDRIDETLTVIEDALDDAETDIDYLTNGGVLTIICENKSQIILTRQTPVKQLWVATRSGGYHFDFNAESDAWLADSDQEPLKSFLEREFELQAGEALTFDV